MATLNGHRVMLDNKATTVKRSWKERLFTRPWQPWKKTNYEVLPLMNQAADLIEKLTGEPSEAMSEAGVEASRYYVTGYTATNLSYKAMITQAIREVIERKPIEIRESDGE